MTQHPESEDSDSDSDSEDDISNKEMLEGINNTLRQHTRRQDKKIKALERKIDFLVSILAQPTDPIPPGVSGKTWTTWSEAVKKGQPQGKGSRRTTATPASIPLPIGNAAKKTMPEPKPEITKAQRRIVILREPEETKTFDPIKTRDTINETLAKEKAPTTLKVASATLNPRGNVVILTKDDCTSEQILKYKDQVEKAAKAADPKIKSVQSTEHWAKVLVHGVSLEVFPDTPSGLASFREEIETYNSKIQLATYPRYLTKPESRQGKEKSSIVIALRNQTAADYTLKHGVMVKGSQLKTVKYLSARPFDQCSKCQSFGHHWQRCNLNGHICKFCAGLHPSNKHECKTCDKQGKACPHTLYRCYHCGEAHAATDPRCMYIKQLHQKYNVRPNRDTEQEMDISQ